MKCFKLASWTRFPICRKRWMLKARARREMNTRARLSEIPSPSAGSSGVVVAVLLLLFLSSPFLPSMVRSHGMLKLEILMCPTLLCRRYPQE